MKFCFEEIHFSYLFLQNIKILKKKEIEKKQKTKNLKRKRAIQIFVKKNKGSASEKELNKNILFLLSGSIPIYLIKNVFANKVLKKSVEKGAAVIFFIQLMPY